MHMSYALRIHGQDTPALRGMGATIYAAYRHVPEHMQGPAWLSAAAQIFLPPQRSAAVEGFRRAALRANDAHAVRCAEEVERYA